MTLIYLDACALIELREKTTPTAQALVDLIVEFSESHIEFVTSELTLTEVLVVPLRSGLGIEGLNPSTDHDLVRDWYLGNLVPEGILVRTEHITREILIDAARIRARHSSVRTPDAIHTATAMACGCSRFVTRDPRLVRAFERDDFWAGHPRRFDFVSMDEASVRDLIEDLRQ